MIAERPIAGEKSEIRVPKPILSVAEVSKIRNPKSKREKQE
jgi:hypothetical protein